MQAQYLARGLELAREQPSVAMLVWFVFRDEPGQPWQSGLLDSRGRAKPSLARFAADARPDARALRVQADPTSLVHDFRVPALELRSHLDAGAHLGVRYSLAACGKSVADGMTATRMGSDGWVPVTTRFRFVPGTTYSLDLRIEDTHGQQVTRKLSVSVQGAAPASRSLAAACR